MPFVDELRALVGPRHVIAKNMLESENPYAEGARQEINRMWEIYQELAEPEFVQQFARDPESKYWEMYVGCSMSSIGLKVHRENQGPDFWVEGDAGRIWIEAIAPEPGTPGNPDAVPEPIAKQAADVPVVQILLRLTGAIHKKQAKFKHYYESGVVPQSEICVIALSAAKLWYPVTPDYVRRAVYEAGSLYVTIDPKTLETVEQGLLHEPQIAKQGNLPFDKPTFLNDTCNHISGLLFGWRGIANTPAVWGSELALFHNHKAKHPLARGWLRRGSEHWAEVSDTHIHFRSQEWND